MSNEPTHGDPMKPSPTPAKPEEVAAQVLTDIEIIRGRQMLPGAFSVSVPAELLDALARAVTERGLRTPGTVEVCERHLYSSCADYPGPMRKERIAKCLGVPCPLKPRPATEGDGT